MNLEKKVLLYLSLEDSAAAIKERLLQEGNQVYLSSSADDALRKLRFEEFGVVIVEESLDKSLTDYLENLPMTLRREIVYVLITEELETGDHLPAYTKSADLVVNTKDIDSVGELLNQTIKEHQEFYGIFKSTLREIGKR